MAALNVKNRTLFIGDNLPVLRGINSETIDLIATDPPFNKSVKAFKGKVKAGEDAEGKEVSYKDVWTWDKDVQAEWTNRIHGDHPALYNVIMAANDAAGDDMGAFLCWLAVRVLECHRILKSTGSMYLHIDQTAHAYAKAMMDAIFGKKNFRNEIVWAYSGGGVPRRDFPRKHDTILRYTKSDKYTFNVERKPFKENTQQVGKHSTYSGGEAIDLERGTPVTDFWPDIKTTTGWSPERTGYPTQKPLALYERMIKASSNVDDVVLDPFAGCATTCVAAEQADRKWIGIDILDDAKDVTFGRLRGEVNKRMNWDKRVTVKNTLPVRSDDGAEAAPELRVVSRKKNDPKMPTREIRTALIRAQTMRCQGCGWIPHHEDYLQVDHVMPRARGGRDVMDNYTLLCQPCNQRKGHKLTLTELREDRVREGRIQDKEWADMAGWR